MRVGVHCSLSRVFSMPCSYRLHSKIKDGGKGWGDGSEVKSTGCSCRGLELDSQTLQGYSLSSIPPVPGEPALNPHRHQEHVWYTGTYTGKSLIHVSYYGNLMKLYLSSSSFFPFSPAFGLSPKNENASVGCLDTAGLDPLSR